MTVITLAEAEREFVESIAYYVAKEVGLGVRFRNEVAETLDWIIAYPGDSAAQEEGLSPGQLARLPSLRSECHPRGDDLE